MNEGDIVGQRFVIERLLGTGGMAEVFLANDRVTGDRVALKMFPRQTAEIRARFEREAEILAGLVHPGIVRYVAHGAPPDGSLYLAMEFLEGEDLASRLVRGPLSVDETMTVAKAVAEALAVAHPRGVLHRDIKPANLFLAQDSFERLKLLDFGIARIEKKSTLTEVGFALGTPDYMAPEQARGDMELTPAVDVFSLGCVLFECLTGNPPFAAGHPLAVLGRILMEEPAKLTRLRADVPLALEELVGKLLTKLPEERPKDATAVLPLIAETRAAIARAKTPPGDAPRSLTRREQSGVMRPIVSEPTPMPVRRTLLGRLQPCFGREDTIARVTSLFEATLAERRARAVLAIGPAGIGKSRLRAELARAFTARDTTAFYFGGRGDPSRVGEPFGLVSACLRSAFGIREDEPLAVRCARIVRYVASARREGVSAPLSEDTLHVAQFLGELAGTPFPDEGSPLLRAARADGIRMGDQMWRAWHALLDGITRQSPVVFMLDDLDFTDRPSLTFIDAELRNLHDRPVFVLGFARAEVDERFPKLWADRRLERISVGPIDREASRALVTNALADAASPEAIERIVTRGEGNPLYLEEMIRAFASGDAEVDSGDVQAMVVARLDALSPETRRVMRAASVFGRVAWRTAIGALCGGLDAEVDAALDELCRREILVPRGAVTFQGEVEFAFRHGLVRDTAYAMLTDDDRLLGHSLAARWLAERRPGEALAIAAHFANAAEPRGAIAWYERSAELALEGNDFASGIERAERAIVSGAEGLALGKLKLLASECHRHRGENVEMLDKAEEAREILARGTIGWFRAIANVVLGSIRLGRKELIDGCIADLGRELAARDRPAFPAPAARIAHYLHFAGQHDFATRLLSAAWSDHDGATGGDEVAAAERAAWFQRACATRALVHGDVGSYLDHLERAVKNFERAGDVREPANERVNVGFARMELGLYEEAEATLRQALDDTDALGLLHGGATARSNLGGVLARRGAFAEARRLLGEAISTFAQQKNRRMEGNARVYLGEAFAEAGDLEGGARELEAAADLLATVKPLLPMALAALARVELAMGRTADARAHAERASEGLSMVAHLDEGEAIVHLARAEVLLAEGHRTEARSAAAAARDRLLERAGKIQESRWRGAFLSVKENARTLDLARELEAE